MSSVNTVILVGNLGKDPEVRYLPSGVAVANCTLATSSKRKDKNSGETIEETQWHRITFFDRLAEIVNEYVKKGDKIYIQGTLKYGSYEKDGVKHYTTEIVANQMQMLSSSQGQGQQRDDRGQQRQPQQPQQRDDRNDTRQQQRPPARSQGASQQQRPAQQRQPAGGNSGFDDMDDDIPF